MMRPFGVEIELNLINQNLNETIDYVSSVVQKSGLECFSQGWSYNHNNSVWICKPDSSCGIEVCSPVLKDLEDLKKVLDIFDVDQKIQLDQRCSFHVHFSVDDLISSGSLYSVLIWWIKFEHVFMDFSILERKYNQYCKCIGMTDIFDHNDVVSPEFIISKLGDKYLSLNTYHLKNGNRKAIEFRLAEGTKNFEFAFNWITMLNLFIETFRYKKIPKDYKWEDPNLFFDLVDFKNFKEVKKWFINRLVNNRAHSGYWSLENREKCIQQYKGIKI